jgi:hypothetical protein
VKKSLLFQVLNCHQHATDRPQREALPDAVSVAFVAQAQQIGLTN